MLLIALVIIFFLGWRSILRYNRFFNPFTLSIQGTLLFLIIPQLFLIGFADGTSFLSSDIVIILNIISIWIGTKFTIKTFYIQEFGNRKILVFFLLLLAMLLFLGMLPMLLSYGISFRGLRLFYEEIVFSPLASLYEAFKTILLFLISVLFLKHKKVNLGIVILVIFIVFSGSKMAILSTVVLLATLYEEFRNINYHKLFIVFLCVFCFMLYYHFIQSTQEEIFKSALSYFDIYDNQAMAIDMFLNGELEYFNGKISLSTIIRSIPRIIWPDKPVAYGFALLNYKIYPEYAAEGYMPSFGLAYSFADFGFISIFASGFFTGFVKNYFYKTFLRSNRNGTAYILYLFSFNAILCLLLILSYLVEKIKK